MADTWPYPLTFKEQAHYPIIQEPTSPWYLLEVPNEPFLEINSAQNLHWPLGERESSLPPLPPLPLHDSHKQMWLSWVESSRLPYSRDDSLEFCKRTPDGGINKIGPRESRQFEQFQPRARWDRSARRGDARVPRDISNSEGYTRLRPSEGVVGDSTSMRELRVPRGMRKNAGQFIGIHFVLPHAVRPIMIVRLAVDLCLRSPLKRLIFHQLSFSAFSQ